jgi:tetratricopeptide (TPR) repeat protein
LPTPPRAAPLPDDSSLLAKITPTTTPQRAASLRLTEEGRRLLEAGDPAKALSRLEKTIAIDSTNPYGYFFLGKAHYSLGRHQESLKFLDVAESLFAGNPYWLAEVFALRGEDYRALGAADRADANYAQALRLNPGNRMAAEGLSRLQGEPQSEPR